MMKAARIALGIFGHSKDHKLAAKWLVQPGRKPAGKGLGPCFQSETTYEWLPHSSGWLMPAGNRMIRVQAAGNDM